MIALTLKIEWPASESVTTTVPVEISVFGLEELALKFAPDPSATALAAISPPSAITSRRGSPARAMSEGAGARPGQVQSTVVVGGSATAVVVPVTAVTGSAMVPPPVTIGASNQATSSGSGRGGLE